MKKSKLRLCAAALALSIIFGNIATACYALDVSQKEEVIYISLNANGAAQNIDVVNILTPDANGEVLDYGDYSSVRNMTTTDALTYKDGQLTAKTGASKLYYDGLSKSNVTPWNISVKYFLDGKEIATNDLAGKSGALKIKVNVTRNNDYTGPDFYKNYALQGTIKLDSTKCTNIVSDKATIANVGQQKQLSYIALPNKGFDFDITADVSDFEYDGVSINAIPLNLSVKIDDSKLMSQVYELQDAIVKVDDGAQALNGGLQSLKSGLNQAQSMINGINFNELQNMLAKAQLALENATLITENGAKLVAASAQIKTAISALAAGANELKNNVSLDNLNYIYQEKGINIEALNNQNTAVIEQLKQQIASLQTNIKQLSELGGQDETIAQMTTQLNQLSTTVAILEANKATLSGVDFITQNLIEGAENGIKQLAKGATELEAKYSEFDQGLNTFVEALRQLSNLATNIQGIVNTVSKQSINGDMSPIAKVVAGYNAIIDGTTRLVNGGKQLSSGTSQLRNATSTLDTKVSNEIDSLVSSIKGEAHIGSFTSTSNSNVHAVQFVFKSEGIKKPAVKIEHKPTEQKQGGFFDKLFSLFH